MLRFVRETEPVKRSGIRYGKSDFACGKDIPKYPEIAYAERERICLMQSMETVRIIGKI